MLNIYISIYLKKQFITQFILIVKMTCLKDLKEKIEMLDHDVTIIDFAKSVSMNKYIYLSNYMSKKSQICEFVNKINLENYMEVLSESNNKQNLNPFEIQTNYNKSVKANESTIVEYIYKLSEFNCKLKNIDSLENIMSVIKENAYSCKQQGDIYYLTINIDLIILLPFIEIIEVLIKIFLEYNIYISLKNVEENQNKKFKINIFNINFKNNMDKVFIVRVASCGLCVEIDDEQSRDIFTLGSFSPKSLQDNEVKDDYNAININNIFKGFSIFSPGINPGTIKIFYKQLIKFPSSTSTSDIFYDWIDDFKKSIDSGCSIKSLRDKIIESNIIEKKNNVCFQKLAILDIWWVTETKKALTFMSVLPYILIMIIKNITQSSQNYYSFDSTVQKKNSASYKLLFNNNKSFQIPRVVTDYTTQCIMKQNYINNYYYYIENLFFKNIFIDKITYSSNNIFTNPDEYKRLTFNINTDDNYTIKYDKEKIENFYNLNRTYKNQYNDLYYTKTNNYSPYIGDVSFKKSGNEMIDYFLNNKPSEEISSISKYIQFIMTITQDHYFKFQYLSKNNQYVYKNCSNPKLYDDSEEIINKTKKIVIAKLLSRISYAGIHLLGNDRLKIITSGSF